MSNDNENSLGDQNTFDGGDGQFDPQSLGDEGTFAGGGGYDPQSLGDEMTFGGGANDADDSFDDGMEVVDLEARYKMEGVLGKGGMGEVLLATDTRLERKVAIKRILGTAARSKTAVSRFLTEAKSVAALNHPNIVQIYDYGRAQDGPFLIMEYVEGESLLDKCRQGPIQLEEAVNLTCQLCEGLAKAHAANIIHRDIKPANVLMTPDGVPKLTDFGLAKDDTADTGMTMAGAVLGTLDFMPPEQRKDAALTDNRSDLWSLAASLYQMVTGKSPKIIKFNDVPAALQDVLARALEDEKEDRYQTALEFRDALRECLSAGGPDLSELDTGQCPSCGTKNDSSRRFCRNPDCGESLEAPCLSCNSQIPMWEAVCGSCGAKQEPMLEEAKERKQGERIQAEELLELLDFKKARKLSENLKSETDPRLQQQVKWATEFQDVIESRYQSEMQRVSQLQSEAMQHEKSFDYGAAIRTLRQVPETLIYDEASGFEENVADTVQRLEKIENHCKDLEKKIKKSIQARQLDGLIPLVDELRGLLPQREDLGKLKQQLIARDEKLERVRRESFAEAMEAFESQDYLACLASLKKIDSTLIDNEVRELQEQAEISSSRVKELDQQIRAATLKKQFDGLLEAVEEYLFLQEADTERQKLRDQLTQRKEKQLAQVETLTKSATQLRNTGKHEAALSKLQQIPEFLRSDQVKSLEGSCNELHYAKQHAVAALGRAKSSGQYGKELPTASIYHAMLDGNPGINDAEFHQFYTQSQEALEELKRKAIVVDKLQKSLKVAGIAAAVVVVVLVLLGIGLWANSAWKARKLSSALQSQRWDEVLSVDPDNVTALIGRANQGLARSSSDLESILLDVERAESLNPGLLGGNEIKGKVYALQSVKASENGDVSTGETKLREAERLQVDSAYADRASMALAQAFIERTESFVASGNLSQAIANAKRAMALDSDIALPASIALATAVSNVPDLVNAYEQNPIAAARDAMVTGLAALESLDANSAVLANLKPKAVSLLETQTQIRLSQKNLAEFAANYSALSGLSTTAAARFESDIANLPTSAFTNLPTSALTNLPASVMAKLPARTNSIGMKLKLIPGGTFTMGDDSTAHQVTLTKAFELGVYEVTQEQYERVMGSKPSRSGGSTNPVEQVSWEDAMKFCQKLSALKEERAAGRVYRLPTEAEWEYACRAGTTTDYSFGDLVRGSINQVKATFGKHAWYNPNSGGKTHPVGEKLANPWGLYDMYGNVWEWCSDRYGDYPSSAVTDPIGADEGSRRVIRGGGWGDIPWESARRRNNDPSDRFVSFGFRVTCVPSGQ